MKDPKEILNEVCMKGGWAFVDYPSAGRSQKEFIIALIEAVQADARAEINKLTYELDKSKDSHVRQIDALKEQLVGLLDYQVKATNQINLLTQERDAYREAVEVAEELANNHLGLAITEPMKDYWKGVRNTFRSVIARFHKELK